MSKGFFFFPRVMWAKKILEFRDSRFKVQARSRKGICTCVFVGGAPIWKWMEGVMHRFRGGGGNDV